MIKPPIAPALTLALSLAVLLPMAGCSSEAQPPAEAEGAEHIPCALAGAQDFKPVCAVERARQDDKLQLIVRHPDGAFRRFDVLGGGQGLAVSDGADPAKVTMVGKELEVTVLTDRYRFPVTARGDAAKQ